MVKLVIIFGIALNPLAHSQDNVREVNERINAFRALEQDIAFNYIGKKIELPKKLEDFEFLRNVVNAGDSNSRILAINAINNYVIVPEKPEIRMNPGIPDELVGMRIYVLSRYPDNDRASGHDKSSKNQNLGRRAILINETQSKLDIAWIPEKTIQSMLKQVIRFIPEEQPFAFSYIKKELESGAVPQAKIESGRTRGKFTPDAVRIGTENSWIEYVSWVVSMIFVSGGIFLYKRRKSK